MAGSAVVSYVCGSSAQLALHLIYLATDGEWKPVVRDVLVIS